MPIIRVPLYKQMSSPAFSIKSSVFLNESAKKHKRGYKELINEADDYAKNVLGCKNYIVEFDKTAYMPYLVINEDLDVSNKNLVGFKYYIKEVKGSVNIENNLFESFVSFPKNISGDLKIGGNFIKDFNGAQDIKVGGKIYGSVKQNVKSNYKLNKENLKLYKQGFLNENSVKIKSKDQYGQLVDILNENECLVKVNYSNRVVHCKTSDVDCLYDVDSILKKI